MEQIIIEGIKQALARGQSLQQAMESFYYAGYPKEEIENAVRAVQGIQINPIVEQNYRKKLIVQKKPAKPTQKVSNYPVPVSTKTQPIVQKPVPAPQPTKISDYKRQKTRPGLDWILILMLMGLFILIGVLLFILFK